MLDNSHYFQLRADEELSVRLLRKTGYFLEMSSKETGNEPAWQSLEQRYQELVQSSGMQPKCLKQRLY